MLLDKNQTYILYREEKQASDFLSFKLQDISSDEYINPVLQSLCADALLSISDEDSDWELNITEFMRCLDPGELGFDDLHWVLD